MTMTTVETDAARTDSDGASFFEFSDWSIAGGAAIGVWVLTFLAALVWCCFFRGKKKKKLSTAATAGEEKEEEGGAGGGRASSTAATAGGEVEGGRGRGAK